MQANEIFDVNTVNQTVADGIYRLLVESVLFGDLATESRLILQDLAEKYQVSLSPIREALQRLAAEGLIEATPRRGYRVRKPSARHVDELWQVRLGLEITAGELLIKRIASTGDLAVVEQMESIQAQMDVNAAMTHREHIALNTQFHRMLIEGSGNRLLTSIYHSIHLQMVGAWVQRGLDDWRARLTSERDEHQSVIAAIRKMNVPDLTSALRQHLGRSLKSAISDLSVLSVASEDMEAAKKDSVALTESNFLPDRQRSEITAILDMPGKANPNNAL